MCALMYTHIHTPLQHVFDVIVPHHHLLKYIILHVYSIKLFHEKIWVETFYEHWKSPYLEFRKILALGLLLFLKIQKGNNKGFQVLGDKEYIFLCFTRNKL